ncbi:Esterase YbfF [Nocardioides dokdonensis FR1436]|uniref:Esterase YbfF n=1 Tax=Nocardioides dokdonensis FR1436 TaxID=1300347 RepID=A0A1A9GQE0_9ACTN|nr:alpha/beta fold hydrolase [Nocardioides dokdonensis]ANH39691.1 Esterase YbfF [Nocardioides dokdonensis FR1436]
MSQTSTSLHSTEVGDTGERVVFLHGLFGQGRNFTQIAKAMRPEFHSLLVDLPNHGRSGWTDTFSYAATADRIAEHLAEGFAADGPVHVVGHSMGGKVAMLLALRHPELVERLVVVDIAPVPSDNAGEFEHLLGSLAGLELDGLARRADADEQLSEAIPQERVRGFLLQNLRSSSEGFSWQANLGLLRDELAAIGGFPEVTESFDHPVLWMAGERSGYVTEDAEPEMQRLFPRTVQVTIKGAGHWVHSEKPEAFISALRTFLGAT